VGTSFRLSYKATLGPIEFASGADRRFTTVEELCVGPCLQARLRAAARQRPRPLSQPLRQRPRPLSQPTLLRLESAPWLEDVATTARHAGISTTAATFRMGHRHVAMTWCEDNDVDDPPGRHESRSKKVDETAGAVGTQCTLVGLSLSTSCAVIPKHFTEPDPGTRNGPPSQALRRSGRWRRSATG
jgi:hypothetical protein